MKDIRTDVISLYKLLKLLSSMDILVNVVCKMWTPHMFENKSSAYYVDPYH